VSVMEMHIHILGSQGLDPIVFMRLLRVVFFIIAAGLMAFEPMTCGGKNRVFHQVLAGTFLAGAWVSYEQARARMAVIADDPIKFFSVVPPATMFWSEFTSTVFIIIVAMRLMYDAYVYRRLHRLGCSAGCGQKCKTADKEILLSEQTAALLKHRRKDDV
jgi:hypothetical protein